MMNYWIHALVTNPGIEQVLSLLEGQHKSVLPNNELSVTYNIAGDEAIIKVTADDAWMQANVNGRPWVSRIYDEENHTEIFSFIYSPEWYVEESV